ncbi:MAG: FAD-dependent oxidoreductase [Mycobacteriales bacterium]
MRVAVVGAGIAGIACARAVGRSGHEVVVLDRGRVPGGRMASRRFHDRYVDLGASYFTVRDDAFTEVVEGWRAAGLAQPWTDRFAVWDGTLQEPRTGPTRWAGPGGLRSLVAALAEGLDVRQQVQVEHVTAGAVDGEPFDAVVLAMPDPQALAVLDPSLTEEREVLAGRSWDPVLVLAARWGRRTWDWEGVFVQGSDVLDWVADDGARRGDRVPVLTAHSTPGFARPRLAEPAAAADALVAELGRLGVPAPDEVLRVQRWTYAKPVGERAALFSLSSKGIGLCGDGWGAARVETAWLSGTALGQALSS